MLDNDDVTKQMKTIYLERLTMLQVVIYGDTHKNGCSSVF